MTKDIYRIYSEELEKIVKNSNTISVFLVGSSNKVDLKNPNCRVNDIDIFVFVNQGENQVRILKEVDGLEFDINYFSRNGLKNLMDNREYFFLKEMKDAVVAYDKHDTAMNIITLCKRKYLEGPNRISEEEKQFLKVDIYYKLQRLEEREQYELFEYDFISKTYLKEIITAYFKVNNKWIPKDKKLLASLKNEDLKLYNLVENYYKDLDYNVLVDIYEHVFKRIISSNLIKLTY